MCTEDNERRESHRAANGARRVTLPSKKQVKRDLKVLKFVSEAVEHVETVTRETLDCVVEV